jgi:hypothetical protein
MPADTTPHNQPARVGHRFAKGNAYRFKPGNRLGQGRVEQGSARRQKKFDAVERDLVAITDRPLTDTEALLLRTAIEALDTSRLKRTHAAERQTANGLRTIERLIAARRADKPAPRSGVVDLNARFNV